MKKWFKGLRPKREKDDALAKYFYLSDGQITYLLARGQLPAAAYEERLEKYYPQLISVSDAKNTALRMYVVALFACVLAKYGVITEVAAAGIKVSINSIQHVLLFALAASLCAYGAMTTKFNFLKSLYTVHLRTRNSQQKADMLAKYPLAFFFSDYFNKIIGNPPYLLDMKTPWQLLAFLVFLLVGLILYLVFTTWVFIVTAVDVWKSPTEQFGGWSKILVVLSFGLAASAFAMPSASLLKRRYTHTGMVKLLSQIEKKDKDRHTRHLRRVLVAAKNLGITVTAGSR